MATKKPVAMCCVTIGYMVYLMPADKGMKVVELMQEAFDTSKSYEDRGYCYHVGEQPSVEYCLVKPSQLKQKTTNAAGQKLLEGARLCPSID